MPKDRVSANLEITINLGNYQNVKVQAGFDSDLKKDETVKQGFKRVNDSLDDVFGKAVRHWIKRSNHLLEGE